MNNSVNATDKVKQDLGYKEDKSVMFISFEEYCRDFKMTTISAASTTDAGARSVVNCHFEEDPYLNTTQPVFFRLNLERDIDLTTETLAIMINQNMEKRLQTYRLDGHEEKYEPAAFSMFLINIATNEILLANKEIHESFTPTLQPRQSTLLASE